MVRSCCIEVVPNQRENDAERHQQPKSKNRQSDLTQRYGRRLPILGRSGYPGHGCRNERKARRYWTTTHHGPQVIHGPVTPATAIRATRSGCSHRQNGNLRFANYPLGDASQYQPLETNPPMSGNHNQVRSEFFCGIQYLPRRRPDPDHELIIGPSLEPPCCDLLELNSGAVFPSAIFVGLD